VILSASSNAFESCLIVDAELEDTPLETSG
jgi:hypothetical protein